MTWPLHHRGAVPSTMAEARILAETGAPEGTTVVAEAQTAGRGRRGRAWASPPGGGVWMTTVLRPPSGPALQGLALVAGLAVWRAVRRLAPQAPARVKWPNDVWVGGRKLAGILLEAEQVLSEHPLVLVGLGINVLPASAQRMPPEVAARSVGLAELCECTAASVLETLLPTLQAAYAEWRAEGLAGVLAAWPKADALAGQTITADGPAGPLHGVADGLGPHGELRLRFASGQQALIAAGEVQTLRPAKDFHGEPRPAHPV